MIGANCAFKGAPRQPWHRRRVAAAATEQLVCKGPHYSKWVKLCAIACASQKKVDKKEANLRHIFPACLQLEAYLLPACLLSCTWCHASMLTSAGRLSVDWYCTVTNMASMFKHPR